MIDTDAIPSGSSSWRAGRSAAWAALAGAWAALCLSLPRLGYALLDEPVRRQALALMDMPGRAVARLLSLSAWPPWLTLALSAFVAVAALALVWLLVLHWLDRDEAARASLRWCLRTLPMLVLWILGLAAVLGVAMLLSMLLHTDDLLAILLLPIAYMLSFPLFCLRRDIIARAAPPLAWRPGWPGWPVIGAAIACGFLAAMAMHAEAALVSALPALDWPAALVGWLLQSVVLTVGVLLWLRHTRWARMPANLRDALRWVRLRRGFAVQWLVAGLLVFVLAPPLLAVALDATFFLPSIAHMLDTHLVARPSAFTAWAWFGDAIMQYWWSVLGLLVPWLVLVASARSLMQVENAAAAQTNADSAVLASPAIRKESP
ncbi:hypothetical protein ASE35_14725 [Lysobacter sp. Root916]|uniref:hypothetical protein n=1 Tax=Lysobacter sp. Root916 TaxID=1736606 RepID=UPI000709A789|nr:hypothetical protein [Lysobacter sp. Root916]KRD31267.1 hypothetical protein ASE35_14725 [Lysobacter sp. Root916]